MAESGSNRKTPQGRNPGPDIQYIAKAIHTYRELPPPAIPNSPYIRDVYFLVEWKGHSLEEATWEPFSNLANSVQMVKDFLKTKGKRLKLDKDGTQVWVEDLDKKRKAKD